MKSLSYSKKNVENISYYSDIVDHNFITTDPNILKKQIKDIRNLHFFVSIDKILIFRCFKKLVFLCDDYGVNRATLKKGKKVKNTFFEQSN